ncbi:1-phosphatidylinositol 4,5-bisphosphate phosphodiesterase eta-2, partial [Cladochytrium tenue]
TNKISFKEVIDVIARYAFVASVYPLFLSLEVHCSEEQQAIMAKVMIDGFGDRLFRGPIPTGQCELPSPADLAFKIVIKGKVQPPATTSSCCDDEPDFDAEDEDSSSGRASPLTPLDLSWPPGASSQILEPRLSISSVGTTATAAGTFTPDRQMPQPTALRSSEDVASPDRHYQPLALQPGFDAQLLVPSEFERLLSSTPSSEDDVGQPVSDGGSDADSVRSSPPSAPGRLARHPSNSSGLASTFFDRRPTPAADDGPRKRGGGGSGRPITGTLARRNSTQKPRRHPVDRSLSDLIVLCKSASFVGTEMFGRMKWNEMCSISENKALALLARKPHTREVSSSSPWPNAASASQSRSGSPTDIAVGAPSAIEPAASPTSRTFAEHCRTHLNRVYPSARRLNSSNLDPLPFWAAGCQMVAFNFQTFDRSLQLNQALFADNGGCGFVLKPAFVRTPHLQPQQPALAAKGGDAPRPSSAASSFGDPLELGTVADAAAARRASSGDRPAVAAAAAAAAALVGAAGGVARRMRRAVSVSEGLATQAAMATGDGAATTGAAAVSMSKSSPSSAILASSGSGRVDPVQFHNDRLLHLQQVVAMAVAGTDCWLEEAAAAGPLQLAVTVISAQQLTKARDDPGQASAVVGGPFVEVELASCGPSGDSVVGDADCAKRRTKNSALTGFNPTWKETFRFSVTHPQLAFLRFQVFDGESLTPEVVGTYTIALANLEL